MCVLRSGNDFTSSVFRGINQRDKTYSHCGIASIENGIIYVYHAIGGDFNPDQKIRRDPIDAFADPAGNKALGIFHYQIDSTALAAVVNTARIFHKAGIMFDMNFNLESNDRMYCAEFVYKTYRLASLNKLHFTLSSLKGISYIGVDDLFLEPACRKVVGVEY